MTTTEKGQRLVRTAGRRAYVACEHCDETQCVDRNEDGTASIEQHRCFAEGCEVMLCENCKVVCGFCGLRHCAEHMTTFAGVKLCPVCMRMEAEEIECVLSEPRNRLELRDLA